MSLQLNCPNCGKRPVEEFAHGHMPVVPDSITDPEEWEFNRAFLRDNTEGIQREAWFHTHGCRRWMVVERDTRIDRVIENSSGN